MLDQLFLSASFTRNHSNVHTSSALDKSLMLDEIFNRDTAIFKVETVGHIIDEA